MTPQNAPTCPSCGSGHKWVRYYRKANELCPDDWHREAAGPPEGGTVREQTVDFPECVDKAVASPAMSAASVHEVRHDDPPPSCHVCGTTMMRAFHCNSCGANTWPTNAAPPAGMSAEQIAVELCADLVNTDPLLYCPATVRKITQRIEAYTTHLRGEVARLNAITKDGKCGSCGVNLNRVIEQNAERTRAALESTPQEGE